MLFTDRRSVLNQASDDDGEPNTYDYRDGFLDDGTQENDKSDVSDEPSDEEEEEEDIKGLLKEANKFKKNKKLRQK